MRIHKSADVQARRGPEAYFTGEVWQEPLVESGPQHLFTFRVSFAPGARTHWHTHPAGQILIVTSGRGFVQREGEALEAILPGDTVIIEAGEKHWHGAAPDCPMQHVAIQAAVDGATAHWLEAVSGEPYSN